MSTVSFMCIVAVRLTSYERKETHFPIETFKIPSFPVTENTNSLNGNFRIFLDKVFLNDVTAELKVILNLKTHLLLFYLKAIFASI